MSDDAITVSVKQYAGIVQLSREMAMDCGILPDDRPPIVLTRRERFRRWRQDRVWRARVHLASWIAGFDVEDDRW